MVPYSRNHHFTGRDDLLSELEEKLKDAKPKRFNHRVAIYGLGGVGKTQIAIEYTYRYDKVYNSIFWLSAADQTALLSGFEAIATSTGCAPTLNQTPDAIARAVLTWLRQQREWLLVIDNLDDVSVAEGYLPSIDANGHLIITTRNPDYLQFPAEGIEIPVLPKDEAIDLLCLRSNIQKVEPSASDYEHISSIVDELGCHALAMEQAAAFIRSSSMEISKFLPVYKASRKALLDRKSPTIGQYPMSVYATVLLSFGKMEKMKYGEQAMKLLRLLAFLNPDGVLLEFLEEGSTALGDELQEIITNQLIFHEVLASLRQYSLISRSKDMNSLVVHRVIQAVTREELSESMRATYHNIVLELCRKMVPDDSLETYLKFKRVQSQIVEPLFALFSIWTPGTGYLFFRIGSLLRVDGKLRDAKRFLEADTDHCINFLGEEHPDTLTSMNNLASTYRDQGKLEEAADLHQKVLEARRRILGEEHPDTLTSMNNLALTYWDQGKLEEAADLQQKVLEALRRILGEEHPGTLMSVNNLALTYLDQGKLEEAADLQQKVLEAQRRILGEEHPDTLTSMNNLAFSYKSLGRMRDAVTLMQQVVKGRERILGADHTYTRDSKTALAKWLGLPPMQYKKLTYRITRIL